MRFVPVKNLEQQAQLSVHRVRQSYIEQRTASINRMREVLSKLGIVLPLKAQTVRRHAKVCLDAFPGWANNAIGDMLSDLHRLFMHTIAACMDHRSCTPAFSENRGY